MVYTIAIDGPAGSGKSTLASKLSQRLGFTTINSGNLYRAVAYILEKTYTQYDIHDKKIVEFINNLDISVDKNAILYNNEDIASHLRSKAIDENSAAIARVLYVRQKVNKLQCKLIKNTKYGIIVEGRDIGTNVIPHATLKIYLDASAEERARRRFNERSTISYKETLDDIKKRDASDKNREHGPLVKSKDALIVNTTNLTIDETVDEICKLFYSRIK